MWHANTGIRSNFSGEGNNFLAGGQQVSRGKNYFLHGKAIHEQRKHDNFQNSERKCLPLTPPRRPCMQNWSISTYCQIIYYFETQSSKSTTSTLEPHATRTYVFWDRTNGEVVLWTVDRSRWLRCRMWSQLILVSADDWNVVEHRSVEGPEIKSRSWRSPHVRNTRC